MSITLQLKSEELGADDVLVKVSARPVPPGDLQILSALPQGGPVMPIPKGTLRVPGFEGVGTILRLGTTPEAAKRFSEGQRVAFFPAMGSWAEYVVIRYNSLFAGSRRNSRSGCGADAHKYDHCIRTHESWSQFTESSDYASRLHPSECGGIWCWASSEQGDLIGKRLNIQGFWMYYEEFLPKMPAVPTEATRVVASGKLDNDS